MQSIRAIIKQSYHSRRYLARLGKGGKNTTFRDRAPSTLSRAAVNTKPVPVEEDWIQVTDDSSGEKYWCDCDII
jgi:hypothetical protein